MKVNNKVKYTQIMSNGDEGLEESEAEEADRKHWDRVTILNKVISKGLTKRVKFELRLKRRDEGTNCTYPWWESIGEIPLRCLLSGPVSCTYIDQRGSGQ